jgi:hypothetical protein
MPKRITNMYGQSRDINGRPTGEVFLELGPAGFNGFIRVEVFVDLDFPDHITVNIRGDAAMSAAQDVSRVRVQVDEVTFLDLPIVNDRV